MFNPVHCPRCGTADTIRERLRNSEDDAEHDAADALSPGDEPWWCFRCDKSCTPYPCPECGSYRVNGALGISGLPFERPNVVVKCSDCRAEFVPHPAILDGGF